MKEEGLNSKSLKIFEARVMYQSIPAVPIPPPCLRSFPNPGGGAIAEIFQPGGGDLTFSIMAISGL